MTAVLGFPYPQERICNLKISVDHSPFAFGSEPAFKLARHTGSLCLSASHDVTSRCHVQVTADNELLARRARRKGRAEYEVQERRSSGGPWRSGCVRARRGVRRGPRGRMAGADRAMPSCARPPRRNASEKGKRRTRCCARARRAPARAGAEAAARGARLAPVQDLRVRALSRRVRTYRYVFTSYNNR